MSENKNLREEQNKRRSEAEEPLTLERMLRDLREEVEDPHTDDAQRKMLEDLLELEKRTR